MKTAHLLSSALLVSFVLGARADDFAAADQKAKDFAAKAGRLVKSGVIADPLPAGTNSAANTPVPPKTVMQILVADFWSAREGGDFTASFTKNNKVEVMQKDDQDPSVYDFKLGGGSVSITVNGVAHEYVLDDSKSRLKTTTPPAGWPRVIVHERLREVNRAIRSFYNRK